MKSVFNWKDYNEVELGENAPLENLKAGVYGIKIVKAINHDSEDYLELWIDIISKDEKLNGFYSKQSTQDKWAPNGIKRLYYTDKSMQLFKSQIVAVERSNAGYSFEKSNFDEKTLVGKKAVGIFQEHEFITKKEEIATAVRCEWIQSTVAYADADKRKKMEERAKEIIPLSKRDQEKWDNITDKKNEVKSYLDDEEEKPTKAPVKAEDFDDDDLPF